MVLLPLLHIEYKKQSNITKNLQIYSYQDICRFYLLSCIMDMYTQIFLIMLIDFTEFELETIANAMDDYMQYDSEKLDTEFLFGGLSVERRVLSIQNKIDTLFCKIRG